MGAFVSTEACAQGVPIGRYILFDEIAAGGMATVHLGRLIGAGGFSRTVAIKRLHPQLAKDLDFVSMFLDEARLAARIRHPNVVAVLDVIRERGELFLVMEYVQGETLSRLVRANRPGVVPTRIAATITIDALHGLHSAHDATTEQGEPLAIVHRDVSPQNVMIGTDGIARVLDFGVAKAAHRVQTTRDGSVKGKISYMAPEQLLSESVDRRADVYAMGVVLWETLTGERLFDGDNQGRVVRKILDEPVAPPSTVVPGLTSALDDVVMRALARDPNERWQSARDFAGALERCIPRASQSEVGAWVESLGGEALDDRRKRVTEIEASSAVHASPTAAPPPPVDKSEAPTERPPAQNDHAAKVANVERAEEASRPAPSSRESARERAAAARSSAKIPLAPLSPMAVQSVAVTPLATLEEAVQRRNAKTRKLVAIAALLAIVGIVAVAAAIILVTLSRR